MAQITIDLPDDLAQRLASFQSQLADLFTRLIATPLLEQTTPKPPVNLPNPSTYQEILDFLISRPTSEQIINFKISETSQTRLQILLKKNRQVLLIPLETAELDLYEQLDTLMGFLKIRAYTALSTPPQPERHL
jgi:hypothetical protein